MLGLDESQMAELATKTEVEAEDGNEPPQPESDSLKTIQNLLKRLGNYEFKYECSGFCEATKVYLLSNIDNGPPPAACYEKIQGPILQNLVGNYGIIFAIVGAVILFGNMIAYGLCCRK